MEPITVAAIVGGIISGLIGNQLDQEVTNNLLKNNIKNWLNKQSRPTNHDIEKAIRGACLNATLIFLNTYSKNYKRGSFLKQERKLDQIKQLKKYLQDEKNSLEGTTYIPPENHITFELEDLLKTNAQSEIRIEFKRSMLTELELRLETVPQDFQKAITNGIIIGNQNVDWFELMTSFFIETVKTNERVKTAIENNFLVDIKEDLKEQNISLELNFSNLSDQVSDSTKTILSSIGHIDAKMDDFLNQLSDVIGNTDSSYIQAPEITQKRDKIKHKITELTKILEQLFKAVEEPNDDAPLLGKNHLNDREWKHLVKSIQKGECVLFLGQEIAVNDTGSSLHEKFFKEVGADFDIKYFENEGFFSPFDDVFFLQEIQEYYEEVFPSQNKIGENILKQLAQIPFSMIISLTPDDTMHRIYDDFNKKHQYYYHDGTKHPIEKPSIENPLIYNILGEGKGDYILTHQQFYDYIKKIELHPEIKFKLQKAQYILFFGFNFNKWYNRLLLFLLEISIGKRSVKPNIHAFETKPIEPEFEKFVKQQFNITYVEDDYSLFLNQLLSKTTQGKTSVDLNKEFILQNEKTLKEIKNKLVDKRSFEELIAIGSDLEEIENNIISFKQKTNHEELK